MTPGVSIIDTFRTAETRSHRAQGLSRLAAPSRPPEGLGLDWPEHGGTLDRIGAAGDRKVVGKFKPVALARLRGFALENGNSTIFWTSKYLICKERRRPFWSRTAVVKTYPIPKRG